MGEIRLFLEPGQFEPSRAVLIDAQLHYLRRVVRLDRGAGCIVLDGTGRSWAGVFDGAAVELRHELDTPGCELPISVRIACAVPRGDRWDWLLQKATELGAAEILPLETERSVVKLRSDKRDRWQSIVREAAEQSERTILPRVHLPQSFDQFLGGEMAGMCLICTARGERPSLWSMLERPGPLTLLTGPEGGFSPAEVERATAAGYRPVSLGKRILRAETAPLAALAWISARHEGDG